VLGVAGAGQPSGIFDFGFLICDFAAFGVRLSL
jgi:hypothetical protein